MEEVRAREIDAEGPALHDAAWIVAAAEEDERAAVEARTAIREHGLPTVPTDESVAPLLDPSERVVEIRPSVALERHDRTRAIDALAGRLYVTTQRLLLLGRRPLSVELSDVEELSVAAERLLVALRDGSDLAIDAGRPRELRVLIAAAIAAYRSAK
jgi:hypothetical protein